VPVEDCRIIDLPIFADARGDLVVVEGHEQVPFDIKRVYYLCDVPAGSIRGGHAHKQLVQLLIAVSGGFDITLDDGLNRKRVRLDSPQEGLLICPMIWREIDNFSEGSVCLVLASLYYDEADYYRDYDEFIASAKERAHDPLS
jgi:dTDP-4-dehydrorhamnose 3,5-epimerase-like enzyme